MVLKTELETAKNIDSSSDAISKIYYYYLNSSADYTLPEIDDIVDLYKFIARNPNTPLKILIEMNLYYLPDINENPILEILFLECPNFVEQKIKFLEKNNNDIYNKYLYFDRNINRITVFDYPSWYLKGLIKYLLENKNDLQQKRRKKYLYLIEQLAFDIEHNRDAFHHLGDRWGSSRENR